MQNHMHQKSGSPSTTIKHQTWPPALNEEEEEILQLVRGVRHDPQQVSGFFGAFFSAAFLGVRPTRDW